MLNLEPRLYVDPAILERERELIFKRTGQLLGPEALVAQAGHYVSADIAGFKNFVIRGARRVVAGVSQRMPPAGRTATRRRHRPLRRHPLSLPNGSSMTTESSSVRPGSARILTLTNPSGPSIPSRSQLGVGCYLPPSIPPRIS